MKKFAAKLMTGVLASAMIFGTAVAVQSQDASAKTKVKVKKVTVTSAAGKTAYVAKGKKISLTTTVKVTPNKKANKKVTYKSNKKKIATVTSKGVVKGVKAGTAKITVTSKKNKKKKATIKVVVKKKAITKVKLNATKATLTVGSKKTLKATATPKKNTCTKVSWKSSKKTVATVSSKGVVTAKKAGSATITATAVDGSKKKATCKVTVKAAKTNLKSAAVQNARTITFALDKATALDNSKVELKSKQYADGTYQKALKVESVTTSDKVNYTVVLDSDSALALYDYVQVSVPSLSGTKTAEAQYKEDVAAFVSEEASTWMVDEYGTDSFSFGADGYSSYAIDTLPAGLTSEEKGGSLYVKGTPQQAGLTTAKLTATSERGDTLTKTVYFVVGSETQIVGVGLPVYTLEALTDTTKNVTGRFVFAGGSESYSYTVEDDGKIGAEFVDEDGERDLVATAKTAGTYTIKVKATDNKDSKLTATADIPVNVAKAVTISGAIKDATGSYFKTDGDFDVILTNKNRADRYTPYAFNVSLTAGLDYESDAYNNAYKASRLGAYKVRVAAGTYDVCAFYNNYASKDYNKAEVDLYKQSFTADNSSFDITLPLYKVTLTGDAIKGIDPGFYNWSIDKGEKITTYDDINDKGEYEDNYNKIAYLKAGSYTLTGKGTVSNGSYAWDNARTDWFNGYTANNVYTGTKSYMQATVNVAISNANVSVAVPEGSKYKNDETTTYVNDTESYVGVKNKAALTPAVLDQATTIDYSEEYCYTFTPETAGDYMLTTSNDLSIFDATGKKVEDTEGVYTLAAGTTYYIARGEKVYSDTSDDKFTIEKPKP